MSLHFKLYVPLVALLITFATQAKSDPVFPDDPSCTPFGVCSNDWVIPPVPFTAGPITVGAVTGISSSWTGGHYIDRNNLPQTANVTLDSSVTNLGGGNFLYIWTITNNGTGDFFQFFQAGPGQGPNFLKQPVPLVNGASQTDFLVGGPPVFGPWGGRWNSGVGPTNLEADEFQATPEPLTVGLVGVGLLALSRLRMRTPR